MFEFLFFWLLERQNDDFILDVSDITSVAVQQLKSILDPKTADEYNKNDT